MLWVTVYGNHYAVLFKDSAPHTRIDLHTDQELGYDPADADFWRGPLEAFQDAGAIWIDRSGEGVHQVAAADLAHGLLPGPGGVALVVRAPGDGVVPGSN